PPRTARPAAPVAHEPHPDPAVRIVPPRSLLADDRPARRRPSKTAIAVITAACLVPLVTSGLLWSHTVRKRLGFEPGVSRPVAQPPAQLGRARGGAPDKVKKALKASVDPDPAGRTKPPPHSVDKETTVAVARSGEPGPRTAAAPQRAAERHPSVPQILLAFALPDVPNSLLGSRDGRRGELGLPEEVSDRCEVLNAPEFQLVPGSTKSSWDIATRTASGIGGRFNLAHLSRTDARTWSF